MATDTNNNNPTNNSNNTNGNNNDEHPLKQLLHEPQQFEAFKQFLQAEHAEGTKDAHARKHTHTHERPHNAHSWQTVSNDMTRTHSEPQLLSFGHKMQL